MKKYGKMIVFYLVILLVIIGVVTFLNPLKSDVVEFSYSELVSQLNNKEIAEITLDGAKATGKLKSGKEFSAIVPEYVIESQLAEYIKDTPALKVDIAKDNSGWISLIPTFIMLGLLVAFLVIMTKQNGGRGVMGFAKSKAKMTSGDKKVTFECVAGADEEKAELEEIVDFLKGPERYSKLGARIPKGVLLVGPPGTGKTLLARAVAGEAGVPFFSISGSDFVEMFVGVGASRVRDLFETAKKNAPCIIFIDEIDAVGRHRGAGLGGGHDEREQTLNQILVEMDGFAVNEGIIIIAATNRPDILDPALLRPGRFDRQIAVNIPDVKGRRDILDVHKQGKPLSKKVDLDVIAKGTPGFTGADLENLMNEAALLTARRNGKTITMKELEEAIKRVIAGPEKKSKVVDESDKIITAYHEAGHAIVMEYVHGGEEVHEISIIPRGMAAGYTISLPEDDSQHMSRGKLMDRIAGLLGGRAAEKVALKDICTGASNDIERATMIARKMVTEWGMSERLGPMTFGHDDGEVFLGKDFGRTRNYSEEVAATIDEEIKKIVDAAYEQACAILTEKKDKLIEVAETLLKVKTISGDEFREIYNKVDVTKLKEAKVVETVKPVERPAVTIQPTAPVAPVKEPEPVVIEVTPEQPAAVEPAPVIEPEPVVIPEPTAEPEVAEEPAEAVAEPVEIPEPAEVTAAPETAADEPEALPAVVIEEPAAPQEEKEESELTKAVKLAVASTSVKTQEAEPAPVNEPEPAAPVMTKEEMEANEQRAEKQNKFVVNLMLKTAIKAEEQRKLKEQERAEEEARLVAENHEEE